MSNRPSAFCLTAPATDPPLTALGQDRRVLSYLIRNLLGALASLLAERGPHRVIYFPSEPRGQIQHYPTFRTLKAEAV